MNYAKTLDSIADKKEKEDFTQMLLAFGNDLLLVHDQDEKRQAIIVTEEILEKFKVGVPNSYDIEWPAKGADGVELTSIHLGDALVIEECSFGTAFYVVQREEFNLIYKLTE